MNAPSLIGTKRQDVTPLPVRFWTVTKIPQLRNRLPPGNGSLQVVAVLHGRRDLKKVLEKRPG